MFINKTKNIAFRVLNMLLKFTTKYFLHEELIENSIFFGKIEHFSNIILAGLSLYIQ